MLLLFCLIYIVISRKSDMQIFRLHIHTTFHVVYMYDIEELTFFKQYFQFQFYFSSDKKIVPNKVKAVSNA